MQYYSTLLKGYQSCQSQLNLIIYTDFIDKLLNEKSSDYYKFLNKKLLVIFHLSPNLMVII